MLRRHSRWRLFAKLVVIAAVPVAILGFVLARQLEATVNQRAIEDANGVAALVARLGIQTRLSREQVQHGLDPASYAQLDDAMRSSGVLGREVARVKIWNRDGTVIYSDDREIVGESFPVGGGLAAALRGEAAGSHSHLEAAEEAGERSHGTLIEVYVPLRLPGRSRPDGAFELYLPYEPIAAGVKEDLRSLNLLLLAGLGLLGLVLAGIAVMTERLRTQAAVNEYQATHDALTGLPNRTVFYDRINQALLAGARSDARVATIAIDLDRFKAVNDTLGHQVGDAALAEAAARLRACVRAADTVARLGGDEFAVLLPEGDAEAAAEAAARIHASLSAPFVIQGHSIRIGASMGIAVRPDHGDALDTLLAHADFAMYLAKRDGGGFVVSDGSLEADAAR